jgi:hypothetical protein
MSKQSFVWITRKRMPDSDVLYTSHTRRCTLQPDNMFRFEGCLCGTWAFNDGCLIIDFRAGGGFPTYVHIFMKCKAKNCWRLVKNGNPLYECIEAGPHNNKDGEIVLLLKVPDDIEIDECSGDG